MESADFLQKIECGDFSVEYYRPREHVIKMLTEEGQNDRYLIVENSDDNYGCLVIDMFDFPAFRYDWYLGEWISDDSELASLLKDARVVEALNNHFGDIAVNLGPNGNGESVEAWAKIISRCLKNDDSLADELDVMFAHENANAHQRACISPPKDDDWECLPIFEKV